MNARCPITAVKFNFHHLYRCKTANRQRFPSDSVSPVYHALFTVARIITVHAETMCALSTTQFTYLQKVSVEKCSFSSEPPTMCKALQATPVCCQESYASCINYSPNPPTVPHTTLSHSTVITVIKAQVYYWHACPYTRGSCGPNLNGAL